jgi:hypothetical protein
MLRRLEPLGVRAALDAIDRHCQSGDERISQKELALEQARFEVARARRHMTPSAPIIDSFVQNSSVDGTRHSNNIAPSKEELNVLRSRRPQAMSEATRERLLLLGQDLPALWQHPQSPPQIKKRLVRTLLREIVVKTEGDKISMVLHWQGGGHTAIDFFKKHAGPTPSRHTERCR